MKTGRVLATIVVGGLALLGIKELVELVKPLVAGRQDDVPVGSYTESVPEQDLAWALLRPEGTSMEQWLDDVNAPMTPEEIGERLRELDSFSDWYEKDASLIVLTAPYTTASDFQQAGIADKELAATLAWDAANDYGWHVFLINADWNRVDAHVTVQVTPETAPRVYRLIEPPAK